MTDRLKGLVVTLDRDYRDDDAEAIINAIRQIKGVLMVDLSMTTLDDDINRNRVRHELGEKLWAVLYPKGETR